MAAPRPAPAARSSNAASPTARRRDGMAGGTRGETRGPVGDGAEWYHCTVAPQSPSRPVSPGVAPPIPMLYQAFRPALFALDPESAHELAFGSLDLAAQLGVAKWLLPQVPPSPVTAMGLDVPEPVGVAAGLDKNAEHIDGLAAFGFGHIECGTVTPRPQPGNPRPRIFRLVEAEAPRQPDGLQQRRRRALPRQCRPRALDTASSGSTSARTSTRPTIAPSTTTSRCLRAVYAPCLVRRREHLVAEHQGPARPAGRGRARTRS